VDVEFSLLLSLAPDFLDERLYLLNQRRQVRLSEAHLWCWNAMMLGIWRNVFVMRMSTLQGWVMGLRRVG
jgi:hypothetical protein